MPRKPLYTPSSHSAAPAASLVDFIDELRADGKTGKQLVHAAYLPGSEARFGELDPALPAPLMGAIRRHGIDQLWSHQVEGIAAARRGEDVLITTPTASGKSLVFQAPVLEEALRGGSGHGLFLFPLKALGQDQRGKLVRLAAEAGLGPETGGCEIYDGDTPAARRTAIRKEFPRVIVSNPDMVHMGVLGHWTGWGPFLADLRWIVLDELHTYRGIFGSHFHHVLQRLLRLCRSVGSEPVIIASSATAANAPEFAQRLTGRSFHWIAESGAPREGRHLLLFRPEASPYTLALQLFVRCLNAGLKTIVFTKARRITELLYSWLRREEPSLAARVASYRAGFLPEERRRIEGALFDGSLDGVISTSALEMGIDVGGLDACILVGYPGSMMATWQRSGRVGRAGKESLTAMVALPDALDQFFLDHPEQFLERPCERLVVDPVNDPVSRAHLICAAAEMPLCRTADQAYLEKHAGRVDALVQGGHLLEAEETAELYSLRRRPQRDVNLRGSGSSYVIFAGRAMIGTVDGVRALHECHPGAVYLHAGRQYLIHDLDGEKHQVIAEAVDVDYFTSPLTEKETEVLEVLHERTDGPLRGWLGRLKVTERVVGYERKRIYTQESIDKHPLDFPPVEFETVGLWWAAPPATEETLRRLGEHFMGSLHASEHAAISLFPLLALCDRNDIGGISYSVHPQVGCGAVFIYDGHPGGVGIAEKGFEDLPDLLGRVRLLIEGCPCEDGCPSCIQSPKCGNGNRPLHKAGAARVLRLLLGEEEPAVGWDAPAEVKIEAAPDSASLWTALPDFHLLPATLPSLEDAPAAPPPQPRPAARPRRSARTVLFDIETLRSAADVGGWGNAHRMGVAVGVVCHLEEGRFEVFPETRVRGLCDALRAADLVIGFNIKRFDYQVLAGYTGEDYARCLPTLDLLEEVARRLGFRVGMGHLAQETLGLGKSADGLQSLEWVKQGRFDLVEQYCVRDVEILRDLYLHGRREGHLLYRDRKRDLRLKLRVDW
jgi:DEAD/DEAH box helicase domain-containing protein